MGRVLSCFKGHRGKLGLLPLSRPPGPRLLETIDRLLWDVGMSVGYGEVAAWAPTA